MFIFLKIQIMNKARINFRHVIIQLKDDLIGKDSHRGVTLTYSWMANQFGHFCLGFIPTLILWSFINIHTRWEVTSLQAAIIVTAGWVLFELYNFLWPLLSNKISLYDYFYIPSKKRYLFQPDWINIAFDTSTDVLFFSLGAFTASNFIRQTSTAHFFIIFLILLLIFPVSYWFLTKMYIQFAKFPFQYRLSQWNPASVEPTQEDISNILKFIKNAKNSTGNHLLIFGGRRSGKSSLGIGLATELSIYRYSVSYYTIMKLLDTFSLTEDEIKIADRCKVWSWRSASLLIIDDINSGYRNGEQFISPENIIAAISRSHSEENKKCLASKNGIWIIGDSTQEEIVDWFALLNQIGINNEQISSVNLGYLGILDTLKAESDSHKQKK